MVWTSIREWGQKRTLRAMLKDPRAARGFRSTGHRCRPIHDEAPASRSRRKKVRRRRRMDAEIRFRGVTNALRVAG